MSRSLLLEPKKESLKHNNQNQKTDTHKLKSRHSEIQYKCTCDKKNGHHQENCIYNLV